MAVIICDLDGTLCNTQHRDHFAKEHNWIAFNDACVRDEPYPDTLEFIRSAYARGHEIVFITGRDSDWWDMTVEWLQEHGIEPGDRIHLYMRKAGDRRSDTEIKKEIYFQHYSDKEVLLVLDDRDRVVEMWRKLGLRCYQVQPGAY
jgi:hydroxymethylpyrimidine pyrophosphatase-like HAD family hydrolase